ncbi:hypothetical protein [Pediococcus pentosaceus]|uniref:hypothetical protein n=1 Tax=Pediococcus pentosaceus TaxID=1255 RepID=UPI000852AD21|nr:hypothetical protein [Pediococcus pentosaceus]
MRFTDRVQFYKSNDHYDPDNPDGKPIPVGEPVIANVTHLGVNRSMQLFGNLNTDRLVVRLIQPFVEDWEMLRINDSKTYYSLETGVHPLKINSYIVGETQNE